MPTTLKRTTASEARVVNLGTGILTIDQWGSATCYIMLHPKNGDHPMTPTNDRIPIASGPSYGCLDTLGMIRQLQDQR